MVFDVFLTSALLSHPAAFSNPLGSPFPSLFFEDEDTQNWRVFLIGNDVSGGWGNPGRQKTNWRYCHLEACGSKNH
ncbi:MAG: hypothetical protein QGI77_00170, partial [Roseibacillus sp.]|nr:hypothetical protein [Roseibacillus sp.]